jgi:hypothetical protein
VDRHIFRLGVVSIFSLYGDAKFLLCPPPPKISLFIPITIKIYLRDFSIWIKKWNYLWNSINCLIHWSEVQTKRVLSDSIEKSMWQQIVNGVLWAWLVGLRKHRELTLKELQCPIWAEAWLRIWCQSMQAVFVTLMHPITCSKWLWIMHPLLTGWEMCSTLSLEADRTFTKRRMFLINVASTLLQLQH